MFQTLSQRLSAVFEKLRGRGFLSEDDVNAALREIRIALLEADVALPVVKQFIEQVRERAVGQEVVRSIAPGQMVVKIVHDFLVEMLGTTAEPLNLAAASPFAYLLVGLQGSGKTTTTGKLARHLTEKLNKKVLLVSLDVYRPAAQHQLEVLGKQLQIPSLAIIEGQKPLQIAERALQEAKRQGVDVILFDTAGRLHIDETLMNEVVSLKKMIQPLETLLVADAMTGQDAVTIATQFQNQVGLTGLILTRVDGDSRGGAALSMRAVTGCPIKFLGVGEKTNELEVFQPDRIAGRILDMGDIVSLVERATEFVNEEDAEKLAKKMQKGHFDLDDMAKHLEQMMKMGGLSGLMSFLPGVGKIKDKMQEAGVDDRLIHRQIAIVRSMTVKERRDYRLLNASRKRRVALGCGQNVSDINRLLKQFQQMQTMMKQMGKLGQKGFMRQGLRGLLGRS
ncbi:signal recognition particle protein [Candidatus Finniella inopinata]|uniref:Signal recognition particle protein n=1 Tax=Candidatus Finniella inopinata TaxID=1696036 RepID=A0A4Q7DIV7_9PROT|nr:signal recognition particle protein [Candidatus Finniella inopinata]RZI46159.1 signal recognition particle protein [Candidatus Finniella inopinata]